MSKGPTTGRPTQSGRELLLLEGSLLVVTLVTLAGMARLFDGLGYFWPSAITAIAVHGLCALWRRWGYSLATGAAVTLFATGLLGAWTVFPRTTVAGIPWRATLDAATTELVEAGRIFGKVVAPAAATPGFVLATVFAAALVAFLSDWAAFRLRAGIEACIPSFALFVFTGALAAGRGRTPAVIAYMAVVVFFVVLFRVGAERTTAWFTGGAAPGPRTIVKLGAAAGAIAIFIGLVVGPALPGADEPPLVAYRGRDRPGRVSRATVSPLVDVRGRLVEHAGVEVFTVQSPEPRYWRLTALDEFDGSLWSSNDTYKQAKGNLKESVESTGGTKLRQRFSIQGLGSIWLPAAYRPVRVVDGEGVSYNPDAASFITDEETADGEVYEIESELSKLSGTQLKTAPNAVPQEIADRYLALPEISGRIRQKALEVTRPGPTPFDRALLLQEFFRKEFSYDLQVRLGHDGRAMERFLFELKRGYCEQFAGAYAMMARSVGLPARVAVGFTQGVLEADGRYHVKDEHAHAWPEVYLQGFGWVAFEPTPGRGQPGAEGYTGVRPSQAASSQSNVATTQAPVTTPTTTGAGGSSTTIPKERDVEAGSPPKIEEPQSPFVRRLLLALLALAVLVGAYTGGLPLLRRHRRAKRRSEAASPDERVLVAWAEADEALARIRLGRRPWETMTEHARRTGRAPALKGTDAGRAMTMLSGAAAAASYAEAGLTDDVADAADVSAAAVEATVNGTATRLTRLRWMLDPRDLLRQGGRPTPTATQEVPRRPYRAA